MAYEEKIKRADAPHHIILEGRERLSISGVEDVESFDEKEVIIYTSKGALFIKGEGLHIERLSLDSGEIQVEGLVDSMEYEDESAKKGGFWSRVFS